LTHTVSPSYRVDMKAIQITVDEELLAALDAEPTVKATGRSAAIREALQAWLQSRREATILAAYRDGYGKYPQGTDDLAGWAEQGAWPEE
jgi:hypothetical protein